MAGGWVAPEAAERLRSRYAPLPSGTRGLALFAVLGASFIGLGVILLLAHNWEALSRGARAGVGFGWLMGAQGLAAFALARRPDSVSWCEASALMLGSAVGGSLALIAQTYHVPNDLGDFLARWILLSLPVVYALDSRGAAAVTLLLAVVWRCVGLEQDATFHTWGFWLVPAALGPFLLRLRTRPALRNGVVGWAAVAAVLAGVVLNLSLHLVFAILIGVSLALAGCHALGVSDPDAEDAAGFYATPARWLGALGIAVLTLCFSIADVWGVIDDEVGAASLWAALPGALAALALGAVAVRSGLRAVRGGDLARGLAAAFPVAIALSGGVALALESTFVSALLMTLYGIAWGSATTLGGLREASIARANAGLALVAALVCVRFVDSEWSFTVRGLVFIAVGLAFLVLNLVARRRAREQTP